MKKTFLSLLFLFFTAFLINPSYSQLDLNWKWSHPKPQGNTLRYVKMFSATNIVAIGYAGAFMSTSNGGTTWTIYENAGGIQAWGLGRTLYSGWFFNMSTGLVCGASGWIARTTTGGATWDTISSGSTATLYGIQFVDANTGFIGGTSGTILKTTNAGLNWAAVTSGTTSTINNIYAVDANHIYAPMSSSGYLRISTDGGTSWTQVSTGGVTLYDANFLNANTGFVCGSSGHVKRTINGGANWTSVNPGSTSNYYEILSFTGGLVPSVPYSEGFESTTFPPTGWRAVNIVGTQVWVRSTAQYHSGVASAFVNYDCGSGGGLDWLITPQWSIMSGDSLVFWLRTNDNGYIPDSLAVRVSTTDTALASFTTRILYCAEGVNYPPANTWKRFAASLNPFAGQNIYVGFKHGDDCGDGIYLDDIAVNRLAASVDLYATGDPFYIFHSSNLGASWDTIDHLNPSQIWTSTWYSMDKNGTTLTAVGASGLINKSTNNGANWTSYNTWILAGTFYDIWAEYNNTKVLAVGSGSNDTKILYSSNGGTTWLPRDIPTSKYFRSISMVNSNTGYIAGSSGAMYRTSNGGANWDSLPFPSTNLVYTVDFVNATTGWAASTSTPYIWKTTDGGATWNTQTGPTTGYDIDMFDANTGWLVGSSGQVRKTVDGGANWVTQTANTTSTLYTVTAVSSNHVFIAGSSSAIRKTTNGGTTWDTISHPYSATLYGMDWVDLDNGIVVASSTGYTAKTSNGGSSWSIETTSGSTMYNVYMNAPDSAWAVGSIQGIYKWAKAPMGVATWNNEVPMTYTLSQNYPNPFNPSTTIKFGIPKAGNVTLNVYDITGRLVRTLFNNAPLNAGTVRYDFDGSNLASGVYFYTLIVDNNKIDTKKMVLVK